jgi:hypothetical protein
MVLITPKKTQNVFSLAQGKNALSQMGISTLHVHKPNLGAFLPCAFFRKKWAMANAIAHF